MKKLAVLLSAFLLLGFAVAAASAAPLAQAGVDLVVTDLTWTPVPVSSSDPLTFVATVENQGDQAATQAVTLRVGFQTLEEAPQAVGTPVEIGIAASRLAPSTPFEVRGELTAPLAGDYTLVATIDSGNVIAETDEENNERALPITVKSVLPPALTQLFAGLGVFAAVMAIMAVGTEVVIDSLKLALGMKEKITALEALDTLRSELPGQLSALGVDLKTMQQVDSLFDQLEVTLTPVTTIADIPGQLRAGHFGQVVDTLQQIGVLDVAQTAKLDELKKQARFGLQEGFVALRQRLPLTAGLVDGVERRLMLWIDGVTPQSAAQTLEQVFGELQKMLSNDGPQMTANWLRMQFDTLLSQGRRTVDELLENDVIATLRGLGFAEATLSSFRDTVKAKLDAAEERSHTASNVYTTALQNLLTAVAERRNKIQSPLRKLYRHIRDNGTISFWGTLAGVVIGLVVALLVGGWVGSLLGTSISPFAAFLTRLGAGLLAGAVSGWLIGSAIGSAVRQPTLGYALRYWFERTFNTITGRGGAPEQYGDVDPKIKEQIANVNPTTAAQILLQQEDHHRDEERTRQRWLRVVSVVTGIILAYLLQIDAAVLLDQALPGSSAMINSVLNISGERLHAFWPLLPENGSLTAGILLTGLAASAGSKFWHDLLGRLQTTKEQAEKAAVLVRKVQGMVSGEEE